MSLILSRMGSDLHALAAQVRNHYIDATLLDGAQSARRHAQADPALFAFQPEAVRMQIRQKAAALSVVRVGNRVSGFRALARDLADSRHDVTLEKTNMNSGPRFIPASAQTGNRARLAPSAPERQNIRQIIQINRM